MGREIKRVPTDFQWPEGKVWEGFIQPDSIRGHSCPDCSYGYTAAGEWVDHIASLLLMLDTDLDAQERGRPLHPWLQAINYPGKRPSADIRELATALAGRPASFMGHDAINRGHATQAIVKAAGLPEGWGICPTCNGSAWKYDSPEQKAASESWEPTEPPTGDGWQLWETVSEGSPVSPVFDTPEGLARHLTTPTLSYKDAVAWVTGPGWAPSGTFTNSTGFKSGIEGMVALDS